MGSRSLAPSFVLTFSLACAPSGEGSKSDAGPGTKSPPTKSDDGGADEADAGGSKSTGAEPGTAGEQPIFMEAQIEVDAQGICWKHDSVHCDPGDSCNPPPPEKVDCPPEHADKRKEFLARVTVLDDGTCEERFDADCEPGVKCNPPAPRKIDCPPELASKKVIDKDNPPECKEGIKEGDTCTAGDMCQLPGKWKKCGRNGFRCEDGKWDALMKYCNPPRAK